ncbi:class I SAM-dependent methyltransferase [Tistrella bauzanensis]|nr:class I SAM-dependent methyltransferase [Tistrella bauzanensis]
MTGAASTGAASRPAGDPMLAVAAIIDQATAILAGGGLLDGRAPRFDPAGYRHATLAVEQRFQVPETTISPVMRRFLWQLARISRPTRIYGAGTYAGFGFAFLVAGRATVDDEFQAWGVDCDAAATALARRNADHAAAAGATAFRTGGPLELRAADAVADLATDNQPIDLLFIDVDHPQTRKALYADVLRAARHRLQPGALILAHDPLVPGFAGDFQRYDAAIVADPALLGPVVLPLDSCGLSIARVVS